MSVSSSQREHIAFLRGLRQVRMLLPDPLPNDALQDILEVARWTGSARNIQPWDLILIQDRDILRALGTIEGGRGPHLTTAGAGIALVMSGDPDACSGWGWLKASIRKPSCPVRARSRSSTC